MFAPRLGSLFIKKKGLIRAIKNLREYLTFLFTRHSRGEKFRSSDIFPWSARCCITRGKQGDIGGNKTTVYRRRRPVLQLHRKCKSLVDRPSTRALLTDVLFLFLSVFHQASPRALPGYSLLWWPVKSCASTPCKINRTADHSVIRHRYSTFVALN